MEIRNPYSKENMTDEEFDSYVGNLARDYWRKRGVKPIPELALRPFREGDISIYEFFRGFAGSWCSGPRKPKTEEDTAVRKRPRSV